MLKRQNLFHILHKFGPKVTFAKPLTRQIQIAIDGCDIFDIYDESI